MADADHPTVYPRGFKVDGVAYEYTRTRSPAMTALVNALQAAYSVDASTHTTLLAPSGMCAIGVALTCCVAGWERPVILHGSVLYCDVARTLAWLTRMFPGARALPFDVTDGAALDALVAQHRDRLSAVYVESAANPTGDLPDWAAVARAKAAAPQARVIVDNTWLSPAAFNPFPAGADVVVESGSKYLSGGRHIWGHATAHNDYAASMIEHVCTFGIRLAPQIAAALVPLLATLEERVARSAAVTARLLPALAELPRVNRVVHPSMPDHPSHAAAAALRHPPSVLYMHVSFPTKSAAVKWAQRACKAGALSYCTSFGKAHSLLNPWPEWGFAACPQGGAAAGDGPQGMWFRLAVGHDSDADAVLAALADLAK